MKYYKVGADEKRDNIVLLSHPLVSSFVGMIRLSITLYMVTILLVLEIANGSSRSG